MKKILILIMLLFLSGCDDTTTVDTEEPTTVEVDCETDPTQEKCIDLNKPYTQLQTGRDTIEVYEFYFNKRCYLYADGEKIEMNVVSNPVDNEHVGEYLVEYDYIYENETYTCQRMVFVIDIIAPSVSLNPGLDTVFINTEHTDEGVDTTDNYTEELTIETVSNVDTSIAGVYQITYTVTDSSGNSTVMTRVVTVVEE